MSYSMTFSDTIYVSSFNRIANAVRWFNISLPCPIYNEKEYYYYMTAAMVREWVTICSNLRWTQEQIKFLGCNNELDMDDFNAGLKVISELDYITSALSAHATNYISMESVDCKIQGKKRKNAIRKLTRKYRLILG